MESESSGIETTVYKMTSKDLSRARKHSGEIDEWMKSERKEFVKLITLLLLGTGGSGKSTIAKQMRIIHKDGFSDEDRKTYASIIRGNIVTAVQNTIKGAEKLNIPFHCSTSSVMSLNPKDPSKIPKADVEAVWMDEGIQRAYEERYHFHLDESTTYFMTNISKFLDPDFLPSDADILHSRLQTNGVIETTFRIGDIPFRLIDVGGQRSQRSKWLHLFQGITAIIYCASLSDYDLVLEEDGQTNRLMESLEVFEDVIKSPWLDQTSIILFLNKRDLFEEKLPRVDLSSYFPSYNEFSVGEKDNAKALDYITQQFLSKNRKKKKIYVHPTTATDTDNISRVFHAVKEILLRNAIDELGVI